MKKPYIKKIKDAGEFKIWYVDGAYIRKNIDPNFTNFADNNDFGFIPKDEFWIDEEHGIPEKNYFIKYFLTKRKLVKKLKNIKKAQKKAEMIEKNQREKSRKIQKIKGLMKNMQIKKIHKKLLKQYSNKEIKAWLVNGFLVRSLFFLDFTSGGHDKVYSFVPKGEVWIDDAISPKERELVLLHELYERYLMSKDKTSNKIKSYSKAHKKAIKIENFFRKNPKYLKERLKNEIKRNRL